MGLRNPSWLIVSDFQITNVTSNQLKINRRECFKIFISMFNLYQKNYIKKIKMTISDIESLYMYISL